MDHFIGFLIQNFGLQENFGIVEYMFGVKTNTALNHILKRRFFYNFDINIGVNTFCERIISKILRIIIKEKNCVNSKKMYELFVKKWENFTFIYDFRGPDLNII